MRQDASLPGSRDLFKATLDALVRLGGSGSVQDVNGEVIYSLGFTTEQLRVTYEKSGVPILVDKLHWARSFLKYPGFVANSNWGIWVITDQGRLVATKSNHEIKRISDAARKDQLEVRRRHQWAALCSISSEEATISSRTVWGTKIGW